MRTRGDAWRKWEAELRIFGESGLTLAEHCRQRGLSYQNAARWRRKLMPETCPEISAADIAPAGRLLPLIGGERWSGVQLEAGGVRITLETGFDPGTLSRALAALEGR